MVLLILNERSKDMELINGTRIISGSMKASKDSTESKKFRLEVVFKDVPLESVIQKALEPVKIQWVNGQGRKNFDSLTDNALVKVDFKAPARAPQIDPLDAMAARLASMSPEEQQAEIKKMMDKAASSK